jgi:hypothetical protein
MTRFISTLYKQTMGLVQELHNNNILATYNRSLKYSLVRIRRSELNDSSQGLE